ncbi:MAG: discoidin domain-containing protein [Bacteroidetes bacterium]|nr:discoidin domain-containing protein [Bacteroidota bacterium]
MKKFALRITSILLLLQINVSAQVDVLTQHNDLGRTGWNSQETILNNTNVKAGTFGKMFSVPVDDQVYAQPLVVTNVSTAQGVKNVVYVATVNNTLYAFDADDGTLYWQRNFTPNGFRPPVNTDVHANICITGYNDFSGNFGIVGTPVIDKASNSLYFVSRDVDPTKADNTPQSVTSYPSTGFYMRLHSIDIRDGSDKVAPSLITATTAGTGAGSVNIGNNTFMISLDPRRNNQRGGLLLSHGILYITFAAHCDWAYYHGWILGYDAATLQQKIVYASTPNSAEGGIWMSGAAPAVDALGNIYVASGNGGANPANLTDRGESVIKLTPNTLDNTATSLTVTDYFTPHDYANLNSHDLDLPTQVMLIPNTNLAITGCKDGNLYVMSTVSPPGLGGFNTTTDNLIQKIFVSGAPEMHSSFAYFGGNTNKYFYQFGENSLLKAYPIVGNSLGTPITSGTINDGPKGAAGSYMSVSSNGGDETTGILWISHPVSNCNANQNSCPGVFRAVKASDVNQELWNSVTNPLDKIDTFAKTVCPTVANGKVYLPSNGKIKKLNVFGLTSNDPCPGLLNVALQVNNSGATYAADNNNFNNTPTNDNANAVKAFDGTTATGWHGTGDNNPPGNFTYLQVNLGKKYDICKIILHFANANAQNYKIEGSNDGSNFTLIEQITNNGFADHVSLVNSQSFQWIRFTPQNRYNFQIDYIVNELEVYGEPTNPCAKPTGITWSNSDENDGVLSWQPVSGATSYNIQYTVPILSSWRTTTSTNPTVSLHALTCGTDYSVKLQAVCGTGPSNIANGSFTNSNCSVPCTLPTRYFQADIGEIGFAGSSCYVNNISSNIPDGTFTLKGSGPDIGGNTDAFQYAFINLAGDEEVFARVSSFGASDPATSQAGIMIRDSLSNTSKFAFIGLVKGGGVVFKYRSASAPGGSTTTVNVAGPQVPYWVKLKKLGTQFTAFSSQTGLSNSWTQVGPSAVNLTFGTGSSVFVGLAATSADNSQISTAIIDNLNGGSGVGPLPIRLLDFKAANINNDYVSLTWSTAMEQNNDHFEIERTSDGTNFETIANVKAVGNSDITQYYSAQDGNPLNGINFYRLKQVDIDGKATYSHIISVIFGKQVSPFIYPNPAISNFTVVAGMETVREVEMYNASGKMLKHLINDAGYSSINIPTSSLASGVYLVVIKTASNTYQKKLVKQ